MISKALKRHYEGNSDLVALVGTGKIFAERTVGDKTLLVKRGGNARFTPEIQGINAAQIQLRVEGYTIEAGEAIIQKAIQVTDSLEGQTLTITGEVEYKIMSIAIRNGPTLTQWQDQKTTVANFTVFYRENFL